mmetsp:Transcript_2386/g.8802  ORF Transcript_2386/g.8802 Transcript_2386/m.8802 type:complete len:227 (-) Transcript_2386:381-1061(-)
MFENPVSRVCSEGPSPCAGKIVFRINQRRGGVIKHAPKTPNAKVPNRAAVFDAQKSLSSYVKFGMYPREPSSSANERAITLELIPAMMLGIVQSFVSSSNFVPLCGFAQRTLSPSTSFLAFNASRAKKNGSPMPLNFFVVALDSAFAALAIVPPLTPPFDFPACAAALYKAPSSSFNAFAHAYTPKSHGTLSYPAHEITPTPPERASSCTVSTTSRTNCGSPVMST